jgi:hypothetical protein
MARRGSGEYGEMVLGYNWNRPQAPYRISHEVSTFATDHHQQHTYSIMAQENLRFLSMDQIESVRPLASPPSLTFHGRIHSFTGTGSSRR